MLGAKLIMNDSCNKKCKYCYEKNTSSNILTKEASDLVINKLENNKNWNKSIHFFGGEPTLSIDVMRHIFEKNKKSSFMVTSNGYFLDNLDPKDYDFMKEFRGVVVSIEGNELAYNEYRGSKDLKSLIDKMIEFNKLGGNVSANISINNLLNKDIDGFVDTYKILVENNIGRHFYYLKSDDGFLDKAEYIDFLINIKKINENLYNEIILKNDDKSDIEYLCTLDNELTVSPSAEFIACSWKHDKLGDLDTPNEEIINNWASIVSEHHKTNWVGCSTCDVELGKCGISCSAFIEECISQGKIDLLERLCDQQKINELLRNEVVQI